MSNTPSNTPNIHFKCDISHLLNFKDPNDEKYDELKIRIEENIKMLKDQIFQLMELSFKNKSQIETLSDALKDIESYKKITNERIEKIFKLVMMTSDKSMISSISDKSIDNQKR